MVESQPLRELLVDTGVGLLEEVGVAQLGLRAIARAAGVSHGAPRRYFPTHRALLAAIAARGFADLIARFTAVQADVVDARDRLARMSIEYVEFAGERPEMFTLMFRHDLLEGSGENLRATTRPLFGRYATLVGQAAPDGSADRALALWTNLHGIAALSASTGPKHGVDGTSALRLIAPAADIQALIDRALELHLA